MNSPQFLYRLDARSPDEIFRYGFKSWGHDKDVARHVTGVSTRNKTSAYIATTEDRNYFGRFANIYGRAQRLLRGFAPELLYVYKIRFRPNCTRVADHPCSLTLPRETCGFVERQREWIALFQIFPQDILEAEVLRLDKTDYVADGSRIIELGKHRRNSAFF